MSAYLNDSKFMKEQLTAMYRSPRTMIPTADSTIMYTDIQTCPTLNQIAQYFNGNKTKYRYLPVEAIMMALHLMTKKHIFYFRNRDWIQTISTAIRTPPSPEYDTVSYGVF